MRLMMVTGGKGMSTAFEAAERVVSELLGLEAEGTGMSFPVKAVVLDWAGTMIGLRLHGPDRGAGRRVRR